MNLKTLLLALVVALGFGQVALANDNAAETMVEPDAGITVNINEADAMTLAAVLDGVGVSRAQAIVEYREKNGRFYSAEELSAVRGIGKATVAKNAEKIAVK